MSLKYFVDNPGLNRPKIQQIVWDGSPVVTSHGVSGGVGAIRRKKWGTAQSNLSWPLRSVTSSNTSGSHGTGGSMTMRGTPPRWG